MSRAPQKSTRRPRRAVGLGIAGLAAVLAVAGCGAGQDTQTDSVQPAVNGALGQLGPIAIRDAVFAFPTGGVYPSGGVAPLVLTIVNTGSGDDELVEVTSAVADDVTVTGDRNLPARRTIQVGEPGTEVEPRPSATTTSRAPSSTGSPTSSAPASPTGSAPSSVPSSPSGSVPASAPGSAPSAPTSGPPGSSTAPSDEPVEIGRATIVLSGLANPLAPGRTYPVTFVFRNAGSITIELPIAAPNGPRVEPTSTESE